MTQAKLIAALAKALPELEGAKKTKENAAFKAGGKVSKYADLGAIIDALAPLKAHGLWYRQQAHENENGAMVETFYIHESGEQLSAGTQFMPATNHNAQGFGSALTYCRRYGLQTAFGLATEDDDGNEAVRTYQPKQEAKPPLHERLAGKAVPISDEQRTELMMLFTHLNVPVAEFLDIASIKALPDLPASWFDRAKEWINKRALELREQKETA